VGSGWPVASITSITLSAATRPSPVRETSAKIKCPDDSPPSFRPLCEHALASHSDRQTGVRSTPSAGCFHGRLNPEVALDCHHENVSRQRPPPERMDGKARSEFRRHRGSRPASSHKMHRSPSAIMRDCPTAPRSRKLL